MRVLSANMQTHMLLEINNYLKLPVVHGRMRGQEQQEEMQTMMKIRVVIIATIVQPALAKAC